MNWEFAEFLLKGLYLGLVVMVALDKPGWQEVGIVSACTAGGLALSLGAAAFHKFREGYKIGGNWLGFVLFLLLEHQGMILYRDCLGASVGAKVAHPANAPIII